MNPDKRTHDLRPQQGGALLVAMVLIFLLSMMGISTMKGSTLERRMTSNAIESSTLLQVAESSSDMALNDQSNLLNAWNAGIFNPVGESTDLQNVQSTIESSLTVQWVGEGAAPNFSAGTGGFSLLRFEAWGQASVAGSNSRAVVQQSAYQIVPTAQ